MLRYPDDMENMLANYDARLKELERRLPALNDDPPGPTLDCCDTFCAFQTGTEEFSVGENQTLLTVTVPRPAAGRIVVTGGFTGELSVGGDFYLRSQISISGTRYHPIRFHRVQGSTAGDQMSLYPRLVFDFQAGADLTVGLYIINLSSQAVVVGEGELDVLMRGRGGSDGCNPVSSGTG